MHQPVPVNQSSEAKPVEPSVSPAPRPVVERAVERPAPSVVPATRSLAQPLSTRTPVVQRTMSHDHKAIQREVRQAEQAVMEQEVAFISREPSGVRREVRAVSESPGPTPLPVAQEVLGTVATGSAVPTTSPALTPVSKPVERGEIIDAIPTIQSESGDGLVERPVVTVNRIDQAVETRVAAGEFVHQQELSQHDAMTERPETRVVPGAQAHYGWLKDLLQGRIERMKQYPQLALDRKLEGRVVVRAVMWNDGTLTDLEVLHSSGHHILDDEALKLLARLSPVSLTYDLGKESITVKIPITYGIQ